MRPLIFLLTLALLASCRSQKEVAATSAVETDSLAHHQSHRTTVQIDSMLRQTTFDFDTLEIHIQRPSLDADAPQVIRLKAVKGRVHATRSAKKSAVEVYNRLDTVKYHQSAAETSTEHTATTRLYNPPNGTWIALFALIGLGIYIFIRKRK